MPQDILKLPSQTLEGEWTLESGSFGLEIASFLQPFKNLLNMV